MRKIRRILIGYDGSSASKAIFEDLKRAGLPKRLSAVVLSAVDVSFLNSLNLSAGDPSRSGRVMDLALVRAKESVKETAVAGASRLRNIFPGWRVRPEGRTESPAQALIGKAREWNADLIAVGASGRSRLGGLLGSTSQLVLIQGPCSVRISRKPQSRRKTRVAIVGVDGSGGSAIAVESLKAREWPQNAHVKVYSVLRSIDLLPGPERKSLNDRIELVARSLHSKKVNATAYVREGDPANVLMNAAKEWNAGCIYLGARGLSPLRRLLLGSVSLAVAARAQCSVEIIREKG